VAGTTEELKQIEDALDKGTAGNIQLARYQGTVKKILEREPKNVFALYLKAKLLILSTRPQDRIRIKPEVLNLVNEMAVLAHSVTYYHRKWALLNDLNVHDDDVYQEQKNACLEIQKLPQTPSSFIYHTICTKFLGASPPSVAPRADFTVDKSSGEPPLSIQFQDRSSGNPHIWNWDFGDGSASHEPNPVHIYNNEGQYTVSLSVTNKGGSNEMRKNDLIHVAVRPTKKTTTTQYSRPKADFTIDKSSGEPPFSVQFQDRSSGNPHIWNWDFGDSSTSREASPLHRYNDDGQYTVSLTVTNKAGSDVITKKGLILVAVRSTERPDSDGIYEKEIAGMVKAYPEIINLILAGPRKKMQFKGYILDAFGGETPKEFHTLMNCVDEEIPLVILENMNEKMKLNAKVETKKGSLKNRGLSPEFVDWAVEVLMVSLINENVTNAKNSTTPSNGDPEILF
jgi:PKD repeat protein